jgi:hypothetical protein
MISQEDLDKVAEIARLHDEAFWHLQKFDGHAKSSDGAISIEVEFGNVWERQDGPVRPHVAVAIYSYVVASDTPSYPNFGQRSHYFETIDQALEVMTEWHAKAMSYQPTEEELQEIDDFAREMWEVIKDKTTIYEIFSEDAKAAEEEEVSPPKRFRDISNGE